MERSTAPGVSGTALDRRCESRAIKNQEVLLKIPGWAGLPNPMQARIVNVSGRGIGLQTSQPVECGAHVEIKTPDTCIVGEVCRCKPESAGYLLGVRIAHTPK